MSALIVRHIRLAILDDLDAGALGCPSAAGRVALESRLAGALQHYDGNLPLCLPLVFSEVRVALLLRGPDPKPLFTLRHSSAPLPKF